MINIISGMISSVLQFLGIFLLVGYCSVRSFISYFPVAKSVAGADYSFNSFFESSIEIVNSEVNKLVDSVLGFV